MLTARRLRQLLTYNKQTGDWHWRVARGYHGCTCQAGDKAGSTNRLGYVNIGVEGKRYLAHRLAFLYVLGRWPAQHVDHKDGPSNAWNNLREATPSQNLANRGKQKNNSTGYKGVWKNGPGWCAMIGTGTNRKYLGQYRTPEEAATAYLEAAQRIYGEFGRA